MDPIPDAVVTSDAASPAVAHPKYTGTLKLNKKGALYLRIQPFRQARVLCLKAVSDAEATPEEVPPSVTKPKESKRKKGKRIGEEECTP